MAETPDLTAQQMQEVDRLVTEEFGIDLLQMMENAGRSLAELAIRLHDPGRITVLAGSGGNGGRRPGGRPPARQPEPGGIRPVDLRPARRGDSASAPDPRGHGDRGIR